MPRRSSITDRGRSARQTFGPSGIWQVSGSRTWLGDACHERACRAKADASPEGHSDRPRGEDRRLSSVPLRPLRVLIILVSLLVGGVILYVAQAVLMPLALAVLLTFLLAPVVDFLGTVVPIPEVGGLHHRYVRRAA